MQRRENFRCFTPSQDPRKPSCLLCVPATGASLKLCRGNLGPGGAEPRSMQQSKSEALYHRRIPQGGPSAPSLAQGLGSTQQPYLDESGLPIAPGSVFRFPPNGSTKAATLPPFSAPGPRGRRYGPGRNRVPRSFTATCDAFETSPVWAESQAGNTPPSDSCESNPGDRPPRGKTDQGGQSP